MTTLNGTEEARGWGRLIVSLAVVAFVAWAGYQLLRRSPDGRKRDAAGHCVLRAHVYTDGEGTQNPRRIVGVQNLDELPWTDVEVTISGVSTRGGPAGQPTGPFTLRLPVTDSAVAPRKVREILLDQLQSPAGPRWIAMTMRATEATVTAKIAGEQCTYQTSLPEPNPK